MWTFKLDLNQSCIRKRNEAAEDLLHYILDSVDCPKELDQEEPNRIGFKLAEALAREDDATS